MNRQAFILLMTVSTSAAAYDAMEWESAIPIEELIDEDSGSVKFYLNNPEKTIEASEKIPKGYLPESEARRMDLLYKNSKGDSTQGFSRSPAHSEEMEASADKLKLIEKRLMERSPQSTDKPQEAPSFWGTLGDSIGNVGTEAWETAKDGAGQLYRGVFSAPPDLVFGESVHQVAIIQSAQGYIPQKVPLARGVKTRLYISGNHENKLAFVSDAFNIQRSIQGNHGVTVIEFTPETIGMHKFYDPINKMEGWFLVR